MGVFRAFNILAGRARSCVLFTGIVQGIGTVVATAATPQRRGDSTPAHRLEVELGALSAGLEPGASVAVDGACLTVAERRGSVAVFDIVPETWRRTTLSALRRGQEVHLERSLRAGDPLDGHFVQGHVDGIGVVARTDRTSEQWKLWIRAEPEVLRYIVPKGSVALDGTSLTVVDVAGEMFSVVLVPTTLQRTTFGRRLPGDRVNVETDILARLVLARLAPLATRGQPDAPSGLTWDRLRDGGFAT